ncbi:MAG: DUF1559 domain-containing protein [Pirellulaceae bacterium]
MPFRFECPHCESSTLVDDSYSGRAGHCAQCGKPIQIPPFAHGRQPLDPSRGSLPDWVTKRLGYLLPIAVSLLLIGSVAAISPWLVERVRYWQSLQMRQVAAANLSRIAQALASYADRHGRFPPAEVLSPEGKPLYGWRVLILPELDEEGLYQRFRLDEPWDSENNLELVNQMPAIFASPADSAAVPSNNSNYYVISGSDSLVVSSGLGRAVSDLIDPLDQTLLVVESAAAGNSYWTQAGGLPLRSLRMGVQPGKSLGGVHPGGALGACVDGTVVWLDANTPARSLRTMAIPDDGGIDGLQVVPQ